MSKDTGAEKGAMWTGRGGAPRQGNAIQRPCGERCLAYRKKGRDPVLSLHSPSSVVACSLAPGATL